MELFWSKPQERQLPNFFQTSDDISSDKSSVVGYV